MGINQNVFKLLLLENSYKPITGNFLSIGKHTVSMNNNIICNLLKDYGMPFLNNKDIDTSTRHSSKKNLSDTALLKSFSNAKYSCLDVSNYEGANIIHDIALLHSLGIRLILVHGARPQITANLLHNKYCTKEEVLT